MATTTTTTLGGLMQTVNTAIASNLNTYTQLWNATFVAEANDTLNVVFPVIGASHRSATANTATDGSAVTTKTITVGASAVSLASYPIVATIPNVAIKGGMNVAETVIPVLGREVGNTIDKLIYSVAKAGFSTSISSSDGVSLADITNSVAALKAAGFYGPFAFIGDWRMIQGTYGIMNDVQANMFNTVTNDEIARGVGYLGSINGVEIYGTHMSDTYTDATSVWSYGFVISKDALGFGYGAPLIDYKTQDAPLYDGVHVYGSTFAAAKVLDATGGKRIEARVALS